MTNSHIQTAQTMFLIIWMQVIPVAVHVWRLGDHFEGGLIFTVTSAFSVLGVAALQLAVRDLRRERLA